MKIRHELNILNREVTGTSGDLVEEVEFKSASYNGLVSGYLEVVAKISSGSGTITLNSVGNASKVALGGYAPEFQCSSIHGNGNFLFSSHMGGGVKSWSVSSSGLTLIDSAYHGGSYYDVWAHNDVIFCACNNDGIRTYTLDASGNMTVADSDVITYGYDYGYRHLWSNGTYVWALGYYRGIHTYSANSSGTLTYRSTVDDGSYPYTCIFGQGGFIFAGQTSNSGLFVYSIGSYGYLTLKSTYTDNTPWWYGLYGDGTYIFAVATDGLYVFSYDAAGVLTLEASDFQGTDRYSGVFWDGTYIYANQLESGMRVYTFSGGALTYVGAIGPANFAWSGCYQDANFLYSGRTAETGIIYFMDPSEMTISNTTYARNRISASVPLGRSHLTLSSSAISIMAARIVLVQDVGTEDLMNSECQFEIGSYVLDMWTNSVTQPLASPKYWHYDATKWEGGGLSVYGEVAWRALNARKGSATITIQQDDGSFGNWADVVTIVSAGVNLEVTTTRSSDFASSLTSGRNYRLAVNQLASKAGAGNDIYNAKIIVRQGKPLGAYPIDVDVQGTGSYNGVWGDGTYIYAACGADGLRSYSVDSYGNLTYIDVDVQGTGLYQWVWGDGTYIYCACGADGIRSYSVDASGYLTYIAVDDQGDDYKCVWGDGSFIYVACGVSGLRSYSVDGSGNLTYIDVITQGGSDFRGVWGDGSYVYAVYYEGLASYSIDGLGNMTLVDTDESQQWYICVWGDGTFIYTIHGNDGISSYSVDASGNLTFIMRKDDGYSYRRVWGDGNYIYASCYSYGVRVYSVDEEGYLGFLDIDNQGGYYAGLWTDSNFVYITCGTSGLRTYHQTKQSKITKLEEQHLLVNSEQTSTGLKDFDSFYDVDEYEGVTINVFPEHDADSASASTKIQEGVDGTPSDVANSTITGNNRTRGTTALSINDNKDISTYVVAVG